MPVKRCIKIKIEEVDKPKSGMFMIYIDAYWVVTPDNEILLYKGTSPQCNQNPRLVERFQRGLYPECGVRQLPIIYLPIDPKDFA